MLLHKGFLASGATTVAKGEASVTPGKGCRVRGGLDESRS